ncbi:glutamate racemase [Clostridium sp. D2Q-11]|uniref:Glutamate racemase n=1 Tax=Anaeromonas frigoriresistens TaxID=2683708 RepID=A0A942UQC7_9FIRM|nr:glutamate racemase [Anaeromonas frigoriresistens]MBS4537258.1 glutamate racemase [Anaeromonas frigoriresistens]
MKIGIFDSGVGGITVLKEALKQLPNEEYIYYADTENVPYGTKPKEEVKGYIFNVVKFLADKDIDALVIACNTATSIAVKELRKKYSFPIIGMEPAVKPAIEKSEDKKVLVTATTLTLKEQKFQDLVTKLHSEDIVDPLPLPKLVEYAENFIFDEEIIIPYLQRELSSYNLDEYGTIVLGCTHFPFYKDYFKKIVPNHIEIIDGNEGTIKHLKNTLNLEDSTLWRRSKVTFYLSGKEDKEVLKKYLDIIR